jgi:oligopeptide/dipeptide ABC transporter ATP-binding protein
MVFQNPFSSLNPRRRIRDILREGYKIHHISAGEQQELMMRELVEKVGLPPDILERYPHQLSGGQRQRIVVARALSVRPDFLVADEPVSSLDVSIQAQVLNLLKSLREENNLTVLLIAHDLRVVYFFCDRISVMYLGRIVELAPKGALVERPLHPYTKALIAAAPDVRVRRALRQERLKGEVGDASPSPKGCVFAHRCSLRTRLGNPGACIGERPPLRSIFPGHYAACHFAEDSTQLSPAADSMALHQ